MTGDPLTEAVEIIQSTANWNCARASSYRDRDCGRCTSCRARAWLKRQNIPRKPWRR